MKRLDLLATGIFRLGKKHGDVLILEKGNGWIGNIIMFMPPEGIYGLYFGKMTIGVDSIKISEEETERLCVKEIKLRLMDSGWYRSGLRRLLRNKKMMKTILTEGGLNMSELDKLKEKQKDLTKRINKKSSSELIDARDRVISEIEFIEDALLPVGNQTLFE